MSERLEQMRAHLHTKLDDVLATKWNFRFYVIPAAPSALFGWMN